MTTIDFLKKSGVIPGMLVKGKNNGSVMTIIKKPRYVSVNKAYLCNATNRLNRPDLAMNFTNFCVADSKGVLMVEILGISRKYALKKFDHLINQDIEDRNPMALRIMLNSRYGSLGRNEVMDHATEASNIAKKIKT